MHGVQGWLAEAGFHVTGISADSRDLSAETPGTVERHRGELRGGAGGPCRAYRGHEARALENRAEMARRCWKTRSAPREAADQAPREAADQAPREAADQAPREAADQAPREAADQAPREAADQAPREAAE